MRHRADAGRAASRRPGARAPGRLRSARGHAGAGRCPRACGPALSVCPAPTAGAGPARVHGRRPGPLQLTRPWADGTTHLLLDPIELLERLAVLVPRPRINLILYYGVLGARAAWRPLIVPNGESAEALSAGTGTGESMPAGDAPIGDTAGVARAGPPASRPRPADRLWADLMRRSFGLDTLACPNCGGDTVYQFYRTTCRSLVS